MFTKVKGYHKWTSYSSVPITLQLQITSYPKEERGEITGYQLVIGYEKFLGTNIKDLNDKLICLASQLKDNEVYVIWTDKLPAIKGFFRYCINYNIYKNVVINTMITPYRMQIVQLFCTF